VRERKVDREFFYAFSFPKKLFSCYENQSLTLINWIKIIMKEFIEYLVKNLVDNPANVEVRCVEADKGIVVEVRVDPTDVGKVVGRKGMTIKALRTISMMVCARLGRRVRVELVE
jgi:predicted RNA-binding protein YlqC (UPF0109 family)